MLYSILHDIRVVMSLTGEDVVLRVLKKFVAPIFSALIKLVFGLFEEKCFAVQKYYRSYLTVYTNWPSAIICSVIRKRMTAIAEARGC